MTNKGTRKKGHTYEPALTADDLRADDLRADVPDSAMPSWESQAAQYPRTGPPGISYFRAQVMPDYHVDCLLYRDENGELVGIFNHYPADFPPYEKEGNANIWVRPDRRRKGIANELYLEALTRWEPRPGTSITETGLEWLKGLERKYEGTERDYRRDGWASYHSRYTAQGNVPPDDEEPVAGEPE